MDLRLLLPYLEAIECICTHEKTKLESSEKASHMARKRRSILVPNLWLGFPRKSVFRSIATCARGMGVHTAQYKGLL
jgi:hypothetical protein